MQKLVHKIIKKVLNEVENNYINKAFTLDDTDMPDDDIGTQETIKSISPFCPKNKREAKRWIITQLLWNGPRANLNNLDFSELPDLDFLFSAYKKGYTKLSQNGRGVAQYQFKDFFTPEETREIEYPRTVAEREHATILGKPVNSFWTDFIRLDLEVIFGAMNPDISQLIITPNIKSMKGIFEGCTTLNSDISNLLKMLNQVTDLSYMFCGCKELRDPDLNSWDVSHATNMEYMFYQCDRFSSYLDKWHVDNVTNMRHMFDGCVTYNKSLDSWHVDNVTNMFGMFNDCESFDKPLNSWHVDNVENLNHIFGGDAYGDICIRQSYLVHIHSFPEYILEHFINTWKLNPIALEKLHGNLKNMFKPF